MKRTKNITVFNVPFMVEDSVNGFVIDTNGLSKHGGTIDIRLRNNGLNKYNPMNLIYKFIDGSFDKYHKPINQLIIANEKQKVRDVLDVHQIQVIKEIILNKQKVVDLMKDEPFIKMSDYDKFGYQILYNIYHEFFYVDKDEKPELDPIGSLFLSKIPNEYFELVLDLIKGTGTAYLVIQSVLYKIEVIIREKSILSNEIKFDVVGVCSPNNDSYISLKNLANDTSVFGGKSILESIDFTELKDTLEFERAEIEMETLSKNIDDIGEDLDIKQGDTLRDVLTKYTIGATLYKGMKDNELNDSQPNKITTNETLSKQVVEVDKKTNSSFETELDNLVNSL